MPSVTITKFAGLYTNPNDVGEQLPQGALNVAHNVVISRDGLVEPRRGFATANDWTSTNLAKMVANYGLNLVAAVDIGSGNKLFAYSANGTTWTNIVASQAMGTIYRMVEAGGNLYVATSSGVFRIESTGAVTAINHAGISPGLNIVLSELAGTGTAVATGKTVAYRAVFAYTTPTGQKIYGAPTGRTQYANSSGSTKNVAVTSDLPILWDGAYKAYPQVAPGTTVEVFRSESVSTGAPTDDLLFVGSRAIPMGVRIASLSRSSDVTTVVTTSAHSLQVGDAFKLYKGNLGTGFSSGNGTVKAVTNSTTFTMDDTGTNATSTGDGSDSWLSVSVLSVTDVIDESARDYPLYTNPTQESAAAARYAPPACTDMALFRGCMFFSNTTDVQRLNTALLTPELTDVTLKLHANSEDWYPAYSASSSGSVAAKIASDALSMVHGINATNPGGATGTGSGVNAAYASGPDDPPGRINIFAIYPGAAFTFNSIDSDTYDNVDGYFSVTGTSSATTMLNGLFYSQQNEYDSVPLLNYIRVGADQEPILRIVPLRDSLIILKRDGVFRLTGDGPFNFRVDPLDLTVTCIAAESAVALSNNVFCLARQGVVRISDTGATIISRPIEDQISKISTLSTVWATGYESDHKYIMGVPTYTDTLGYSRTGMTFVYDTFTEAWTTWGIVASSGMVARFSDALYLTSGAKVIAERKNRNASDYTDAPVSATILSTSAGTYLRFSGAIPPGFEVGDAVVQADNSVPAEWIDAASKTVRVGVGLGTIGLGDCEFWDDTLTTQYGSGVVSVSFFVPTLASVLLSSIPSGMAVGDVFNQSTLWASVTAINSTTKVVTFDAIRAWSAGAANDYQPMPVAVRWQPRFSDVGPGVLIHPREARFLFRQAWWNDAAASFSSDLKPNLTEDANGLPVGDEVDLSLANMGLGAFSASAVVLNPKVVRTLLPADEQRCSRLNVAFIGKTPFPQFQLEGMVLDYENGSGRVMQ